MWMSGQHKRPAEQGEGQTGIVTMSGGETAVLLDSERRGLQVYLSLLNISQATRLPRISYSVFCFEKKNQTHCTDNTSTASTRNTRYTHTYH